MDAFTAVFSPLSNIPLKPASFTGHLKQTLMINYKMLNNLVGSSNNRYVQLLNHLTNNSGHPLMLLYKLEDEIYGSLILLHTKYIDIIFRYLRLIRCYSIRRYMSYILIAIFAIATQIIENAILANFINS